MTDNQREAGTIILDPTHVSFSQQEGVNDLGVTHFIGIGGAGMSVLAEMLHEQGVEVDGSDREPSAKTDRLQGLGIAVEFGQREENVEGKQTIVFPVPSSLTIRKSSQRMRRANASCTAATFFRC